METISQLAQKHKTDKFEHAYCSIYEEYLDPIRNSAKNILEIGIARGESLRMWKESFPNAEIYGIDNKKSCLVREDRIQSFYADQSDRASLEGMFGILGDGFDLIVDDGSHRIRDQMITLGIFFPLLRPGGYYFIEDLVTPTNIVFYRRININPDNFELANSTFEMLKTFKETGEIRSLHLRDHEIQFLEKNGECVWLGQCFDENSILGVLRRISE